MIDVFATVVICNGAPKGLRIATQSTVEGTAEVMGSLRRQFGQADISASSFQDDG